MESRSLERKRKALLRDPAGLYQNSAITRSMRALTARQKGSVDNPHSPQLWARAFGVTLGQPRTFARGAF
jgi:hypothetical protein